MSHYNIKKDWKDVICNAVHKNLIYTSAPWHSACSCHFQTQHVTIYYKNNFQFNSLACRLHTRHNNF